MVSGSSKNGARLAAAVVALVVIVGSGVGYRTLAYSLSRPSGGLARFPLQFGTWSGVDVR